MKCLRIEASSGCLAGWCKLFCGLRLTGWARWKKSCCLSTVFCFVEAVCFVEWFWLGVQNSCGQATKGMRGMSWRQLAMKGVEGCDKSGGVVKRALIPEFLNDYMLNT